MVIFCIQKYLVNVITLGIILFKFTLLSARKRMTISKVRYLSKTKKVEFTKLRLLLFWLTELPTFIDSSRSPARVIPLFMAVIISLRGHN